MIAPLRRRHRVLFLILGVVVPLLLVLALSVRRPVPVDALPAGLSVAAPAAADGS